MKLALVTGASDGIGKAVAKILHQNRYWVILVARREKVLKEIVGEIGKGAVYFAADVTEKSQIKALKDWVEKSYDQLDLLVNVAGTFMWDNNPKLAQSPNLLINLNFDSKLDMVGAFKPLLVKLKGIIVNIGSQVGNPDKVNKLDLSKETAYVQAMRLLHVWHSNLKPKLEREGVRMLLFEPGLIKTEMALREFADMPNIDWSQALTPEQFAQEVMNAIKGLGS